MALFKPISDMTQGIAHLISSTSGLLEKAGGQGFGQGLKGVVQEALDLNLDGAMQMVDSTIGTAVMQLTLAGDSAGVETAVRFRNYGVMRLEELRDMRDIMNSMMAQNGEGSHDAVAEMGAFLDRHEDGAACSEREEGLKQEIVKLRKVTKQLNAFLEEEESTFAGEKQSDADDHEGEKRAAREIDFKAARILLGNDRHVR